MNKKTVTLIILILAIYITFTSTGCTDGIDDEGVELVINIKNDSTSTLEHIYWMSDVSAGVVNINVPPGTEQAITGGDVLPGESFQIMITTDDPDNEYVKWEDVHTENNPSNYFTKCLSRMDIHVELFVSCQLDAWLLFENGIIVEHPLSTENTLPSI